MKLKFGVNKTRRSFLISSATAAGGMMLSFSLPTLARQDPYDELGINRLQKNGAQTGANEINAWLLIEPDGQVVIRVAQAEMGQGVFTSMPMIVADELEADWDQVRAEYADGNRSIREDRIYKRMLTGGSGAVRRSRVYLQQAGAEARERLIQAAAARWQVPAQKCKAELGRVKHLLSGRSLGFGELAGEAARVSISKVAIKTADEFSLMGQPTNRLDVPAKVNGSAQFGMDVRIEGMVYAAVKHCPTLGGRLLSNDANSIGKMRGVVKVVALDNGVAVVAKTYWQAKLAVDKLDVEWDLDSALGDVDQANTETYLKEFRAALDDKGVKVVSEGNSSKALVEAETVIEADYTVPYLAHACMEPLNCTVHIQKDKIEIWAGVQNPESAIYAAAETVGRPTDEVYVYNCFLGGGFGRRSHNDFVTEAVKIAMAVGRPVQMIWSREEDMRAGRYRPMAAVRFKAGLDRDNQVIAYQNHSVTHSILVDAGRPPNNGIDRSSVEGLANMPYDFSAKTITHTQKNTPVSTWWWRSVGSSQNAFVMECFIDELAEAAGMDPMAFRVKYLQQHPELLKVLKTLEEKSGWYRPLKEGSARGMALHECFGTIVAQVAEVSVSNKGDLKVNRVVSVVDCGHLVNPRTAEMQIESGIVYGLTAALYGKITIEQGRVVEGNFDRYQMLNMADTPVMETHWLLSGGDKWGGLGEPGLPCTAPAVVNAIYKLTKQRIRSLPISDHQLNRV